VEAAGPHHHRCSDCAVAYRLNACVRVNGGHFEYKFEPLIFCCVLFVSSILVPVNVIDMNMCKVLILCLRFSHGSNIANVWQKILKRMTLAFSCEVVHEKLRKSVNICKSYGEKNQWHLFNGGHDVYMFSPREFYSSVRFFPKCGSSSVRSVRVRFDSHLYYDGPLRCGFNVAIKGLIM